MAGVIEIVVRETLWPHSVSWHDPYSGICWDCFAAFCNSRPECPNGTRRYAWPR